MDEVIDLIEKKDNTKFLKKSAKLYKVYGGLIVFTIAASVFIKPLLLSYNNNLIYLIDSLVGIPILVLFMLSPIGLYYSWRSYRENEANASLRFKYTLGHLFFCLLMLLCVAIFFSDISPFL